MPVATSPGYPQHSGVLIPEIWSGKLLAKFYASTVLASIANTDYEGEISKHGDKVHIRTTPDIEIRNYVKGQSLNIQRPEASKIMLNIDRAKYWNFIVDDIDAFQSDIAFFDKWSDDAATQLKITWDREALGEIYVDAAAGNRGATAGVISHSINLGAAGATHIVVGNGVGEVDPVSFILMLNQALDEQNVPENDRFAVLPSWLVQRTKNSDIRNAALTGDAKSPLRNGRVGEIDRMTIYSSNLLPSEVQGATRCWNIVAGQKSALTYASQLTENEVIKAESTFGHLGRGLHVAGWEVIKPEALVTACVSPGSMSHPD